MTYSPPPDPLGQPQHRAGTDGPLPAGQPQVKGFFGALFDFSFNHFVTPSIIKLLYLLGLIGITLTYLLFVISAFAAGATLGLMTLLLGPIIAIISLAFWRVTLEFYLAVVRMSEDIHHRGFPEGR